MAKTVIVKWDKERKLRYDYNALTDFEELAGTPINAINLGSMGLFMIRVLVWAGLKHENEKLTVKEAGIILNDTIEGGHRDLGQLGEDIGKALKASGLFKTEENPNDSAETSGQ